MILEGWHPLGGATCSMIKNVYGNMVAIYSQAVVRLVSRTELEKTISWLENSVNG